MQSLATALRRLERLKDLVEEYDPIKYESTERARELARYIPEAYGAVEGIYRHYTGDRHVDLIEGGHKNTFPNFFEAGYLSGRSFHDTQGYRELIKVVGRVRADAEEEAELSSKVQSDSIEMDVQNNAKATTFDIRAAVARLSSRTVERSDSMYAIELAVNQFNELLKAAKDKYRESIDIQGLLAFPSLNTVYPAHLRDAIARLLEALDAQPNEAGDNSPTLSQKFGVLRADTQLGSDFSAYQNDSGGLGLLFFDIDYFKALNTKYTETIVDQFILVPFQHLLIEVTQSRGFVYSVGGDEFILLLRNVDPNESQTFASRLLDSIRMHTFSVNGEAVMLTLSVGVACYPSDAKTHLDLRQLANTAENKAKREGRNRVVCSTPNNVSGNITINTNQTEPPKEQSTLPSIGGKSSTVFFSDRFGNAFPGVRGIQWFKNPNEAVERLRLLFKEPFFFGDSRPIWWWRTGDMHIDNFSVVAPDTVVIDHQELVIDEMAAVNAGGYYQTFVYIKTKPSEPSGVNDYSSIQDQTDYWGYAREEFALFHGSPITRAEYDDGSAVIDGKVVDLNGEALLRIKYLTPYNLLIAPMDSPINNNQFDQQRVDLLNRILKGESTVEELTATILTLPKRERH